MVDIKEPADRGEDIIMKDERGHLKLVEFVNASFIKILTQFSLNYQKFHSTFPDLKTLVIKEEGNSIDIFDNSNDFYGLV